MEMKGKGKGKVQIVARTRANRDEDPSLASTILFKTFSGRISADMAHISISPTYIYFTHILCKSFTLLYIYQL